MAKKWTAFWAFLMTVTFAAGIALGAAIMSTFAVGKEYAKGFADGISATEEAMRETRAESYRVGWFEGSASAARYQGESSFAMGVASDFERGYVHGWVADRVRAEEGDKIAVLNGIEWFSMFDDMNVDRDGEAGPYDIVFKFITDRDEFDKLSHDLYNAVDIRTLKEDGRFYVAYPGQWGEEALLWSGALKPPTGAALTNVDSFEVEGFVFQCYSLVSNRAYGYISQQNSR